MRASHLHEPCAIKFLAWLKRIKRTIWLRFDFHVLIPQYLVAIITSTYVMSRLVVLEKAEDTLMLWS